MLARKAQLRDRQRLTSHDKGCPRHRSLERHSLEAEVNHSDRTRLEGVRTLGTVSLRTSGTTFSVMVAGSHARPQFLTSTVVVEATPSFAKVRTGVVARNVRATVGAVGTLVVVEAFATLVDVDEEMVVVTPRAETSAWANWTSDTVYIRFAAKGSATSRRIISPLSVSPRAPRTRLRLKKAGESCPGESE